MVASKSAGFVTKPTVEILSKSEIEITVGASRGSFYQQTPTAELQSNDSYFAACRTLKSAKDLCSGFKNAQPISLDVTKADELDAEVTKVDVVISLIPYTFHPMVIRSAIRKKKNVVTTSYISPAILELEDEVKKAGITVMNEIGLDPGIDHLYAVKTISEVHAAGGKILSFLSYCGGLPSPESSNNPLGYKFSWSSRGVLLALRNSARFIKDGKVEEIAGKDLMASAKPYPIYPGFNFVAYGNRDSTPFKKFYEIEEVQNLIRGTLRYACFPEMVRVINDIGFFSEDERDFLKSPIAWREATQKILNATSGSEKDLSWAISSKTKFENTEEKTRILAGLRWIGLFSDDKITPKGNPLDTLCATLEQKMQYEEGERDMVMLQHKFEIEHKDGAKETRTSTLCEFGDPKGYSAMSKLVGVPCAVAVKQVLAGKISEVGVLAPYKMSIVEPLIKELKEEYGIECKEQTVA
ncbi:MAG: Saccharopine dehydrogenase [NADP(+), L-glutamate-forming] [Sclerophora amabilis]|nr:MAG: Saccharopine dehydrogenase [NADP(+), L-glutamate-forming] [Sclerophora amabilis]